ncbi:Pimeloyl-ACP methyl ester carboxylesterase [Flaviramulus basaltis]|uniref:Pimeloyl-ACP methyl ester carboxylesterase n=1 Tax=Flaviramulus basaltis TaxID=369401 RepID=A0A1K2ICD2_9FLAO|nr:alpha/beta fold hydrolase [Flaviramulus basaltis]SFZ89371.1 Pimeloyl-ACP methyl ester carboxylesterase [Flaviramulus basaltis]
MKPITKYAKNKGINIAYQVVGEGKVDLIFVPGWVSNIDMMWIDSKIGDFLNQLTRFSRLILFDKRGTGLSDRVNPTCTLEERMDDILSVMHAVGSKKTVIFGHSEGGTIASLFAATYPELSISLITFGAFAKRKYSIDYPWAPKPEERKVFYDAIKKEWGNAQKIGLEWIMPSAANDKEYYNWFASYLRSSASPEAALALAVMNTESDITNILNTIKVPSLILHRKDDIDVKFEEAKYLAERISNSKLVELQGNDHCFWVGDSYSVLVEVEEFITGIRPVKKVSQLKNPTVKYLKIDIEETMLNNFQYNLTIEDFAKLCGLSLSVFKRNFSKQFSTTPFRWIKEKRLDYAKKLLLESDLNVNQICYESGFINNSHFIKSFKGKFKLSPNQFRIKHTND